ncbi:MAG TPA: hypothetical protein PKC14_03915 [Candidatus Absconditabacterales bacterium]|nr:hypothetical protein [Candidatus Absconditabacterales bacterium]
MQKLYNFTVQEMAKKVGGGDKHDWDTMKQEYIKGDVPSVSEFLRHKIGTNTALSGNSKNKTKGWREERSEYWDKAYKSPRITTEQQRNFSLAFDELTEILLEYAQALKKNLRHRMKDSVTKTGKYVPPMVSIGEMQAIFDFISPFMSWNRGSTADEDQAKFDLVEKLKICYEKQRKSRENLAERKDRLKNNHYNF